MQSYKGKGPNKFKTFWRIQPRLADGSRATFRLGSGKKRAETIAGHIYELIESASAGDRPKPSTRAWLSGKADRPATEKLCNQLLALGLIEELPIRFAQPETTKTTIAILTDDFINTRLANGSEETKTLYKKGKRNLVDCFGDVDISTLKMRQGREFWRWLLEDQGLAENTAKQRLRFARSFWDQALEDGLVTINPFKARGLSVVQTAAEKDYINWKQIDKIVKKCGEHEWRLLFTMTRCIPMRIPSEIRELTWSDVDFEENKILIHSPKTRHIGKSARLVPIFIEFKELLETSFEMAKEGEQYIFPKLRRHTNLGKIGGDIVERAKVKVWSNFWNSIRASAETDLMDQFGLRRACMFSGNSPATAMKNYALVRKEDYDDSGIRSDAKSDAAHNGNDQQVAARWQQKTANVQIPLETNAVLWAIQDSNL